MSYLIDTQILIWYQLNSSKLSTGILDIIKNRNNIIYISLVSLFEVAIKQKLGKLPELDVPIETLSYLISQDDFNILELKTKHIAAYTSIPLLANHRDPFDRLLLSTKICRSFPLTKISLYISRKSN